MMETASAEAVGCRIDGVQGAKKEILVNYSGRSIERSRTGP